jgi:hypothetical protein
VRERIAEAVRPQTVLTEAPRLSMDLTVLEYDGGSGWAPVTTRAPGSGSNWAHQARR